MNKKKNIGILLGCCLLLSAVVVSGSFTITSIDSKPETLVPLGDASGTTTLLPNGEPIFQGIGWSPIGASTYWEATNTNDADTSYAQYTHAFAYSSLNLYFTDLMDGINPPPSTDITISEVRIYANARYIASGIPSKAALSSLISGWIGFFRSKIISEDYTTYKLSTYTKHNGDSITISDVNHIQTTTTFSDFNAVQEGRITYTYLEVDWDYVTPIAPDLGRIHIGAQNGSLNSVTVEINSDTDDGLLMDVDSNYNTLRTKPSAAGSSSFGSLMIGQEQSHPVMNEYYMYRSFIFFDTSNIPSNAVIDSAKITFVLGYDGSDVDFDIVIQNGQPTYPHKPFIGTDWNYLLYSGNGGSFNTADLPVAINNPFDIVLNSTGLGWINKTGITKFIIRNSNDINGIAPVFPDKERISVRGFEAGGSYIPKLTVTYTPVHSTHLVSGHYGGRIK